MALAGWQGGFSKTVNTKPSLEPGTWGLVPLPATGLPRKPPCPHSHQATAPPPGAAGRLSVCVRDCGRALCECVPERKRACERVLGGLRQGDTKGGGSATSQLSPPLFARRCVLKQNSGLRIKQNPPAQTSSQPLSICVPPATPPCWTSVSPSVNRGPRMSQVSRLRHRDQGVGGRGRSVPGL